MIKKIMLVWILFSFVIVSVGTAQEEFVETMFIDLPGPEETGEDPGSRAGVAFQGEGGGEINGNYVTFVPLGSDQGGSGLGHVLLPLETVIVLVVALAVLFGYWLRHVVAWKRHQKTRFKAHVKTHVKGAKSRPKK